ncbi:MAG: hypothetical protein N3A54_00120 [Patescibacteria group bacterium]|nr:hypothetical protein [Patescibacteria group bacterium]
MIEIEKGEFIVFAIVNQEEYERFLLIDVKKSPLPDGSNPYAIITDEGRVLWLIIPTQKEIEKILKVVDKKFKSLLKKTPAPENIGRPFLLLNCENPEYADDFSIVETFSFLPARNFILKQDYYLIGVFHQGSLHLNPKIGLYNTQYIKDHIDLGAYLIFKKTTMSMMTK